MILVTRIAMIIVVLESRRMKKIIILFVFFFSPQIFSSEDCDKLIKENGLQVVADLEKNSGCVLQSINSINVEKINHLVKNDKKNGLKIKKIFTEPSYRNSFSISYKFPEMVLNPGEVLYFAVPDDLSKRAVSFAILGHRQDPTTEKGMNYTTKWDDIPGLTSVQFHSTDPKEKDPWRYWRGNASGVKGAKFAEVGKHVEVENLYDWQKYGHAGVNTEVGTTTPLLVDVMRLVSTGKDIVNISELTLKVLPPIPNYFVTHIFSNGTDIGSPDGSGAPKFGGGQNFKGKFPGALALNSYKSKTDPTLPSGWKMKGRKLIIPVETGKILTHAELAVGDSHPDEIEIRMEAGELLDGRS